MAQQFPPEVLFFVPTLKTIRGDSHACLSAKGNLSLLPSLLSSLKCGIKECEKSREKKNKELECWNSTVELKQIFLFSKCSSHKSEHTPY